MIAQREVSCTVTVEKEVRRGGVRELLKGIIIVI
jgi:hypothetical protein